MSSTEGDSNNSDDSDQIVSQHTQQCTVQIHTRHVNRPAGHGDHIELHPNQSPVQQDDEGVYTL